MARRKREARLTTIKLLIAAVLSIAVAWASGEPISREPARSDVVVAAAQPAS